ncbi:hypothetical protein CQW23_31477 [Capsicum baccatum]|uniref:Uncharacterized protein n=1 Tax=Capsicum baccatum TaxID=33114 RepID=A0A2G2V7H0_CAPBA|nr:hypothetical protein CQW23_31477 [Capsicum baccatum]
MPSHWNWTIGNLHGGATRSYCVSTLFETWKFGAMRHYRGATLEIDNCHLSYLCDALKVQKGAVEAFSLEHELSSNNDSEDKRFNVLNEKLDLKADGDIQSDKQMDNLQDEPSHDPMVHDQSDDPHNPTENERSEKKWTDKEGRNVEGHSVEKEEATEERVMFLRPLNMEDMRQ